MGPRSHSRSSSLQRDGERRPERRGPKRNLVHSEGNVPELDSLVLGQLLLYVSNLIRVQISLILCLRATDQPNAERTNLHVKLNVTVSRILWGQSQNGKAFATGVEYINTAGKKHTVVRPSQLIRRQSVLTGALVRR
jgi:hypothetical protein